MFTPIAALLFLSVTTAVFAQNQKVPVSVYYESLCADSMKFYTTQLYPLWKTNLSSYMDLTLIPFGKSSYTMVGGNYSFTCHHGENECHGNKVQACALQKIPEKNMQVSYINCLMSKSDKSSKEADYPTKKCAEDVKLTDEVFQNIDNCVNSNEGNEYLATLGNMTLKFQNPLKSVPTVVFNNHLDDKDKDATSNFKSALCSHIADPKPAECTKSGASTYYPATLIIPLLIAIIMRL